MFLAPIGVIGMCTQDRHGDLAAAAGAAETGVPMCVSTLTKDPIEEVAAEIGDTPGCSSCTPYRPGGGRELRDRAEAAGYAGIVVTWTPG